MKVERKKLTEKSDEVTEDTAGDNRATAQPRLVDTWLKRTPAPVIFVHI